MPSTKVKGIIIESKDLKEKDRAVSIYTLEKGIIRAIFRGVRSEKAKLKASKNVFTFGDFFIENTKGNNIVSQVDVIETFYDLGQDLNKYYEACSIIDVVKKLATQESDPVFFVSILKALKILCYENVEKNMVLCKFLMDVFSGSGFPINFDECASCKAKITGKKFINYDYGELVCGHCRTYTSEELSPSVFSALKILSEVDYEKLNTLHLSQNTVKDSLKILLKNFQARFGSEIFAVI